MFYSRILFLQVLKIVTNLSLSEWCSLKQVYEHIFLLNMYILHIHYLLFDTYFLPLMLIYSDTDLLYVIVIYSDTDLLYVIVWYNKLSSNMNNKY